MLLEIAELMFFMYLVFSSDPPGTGMRRIKKHSTTLSKFRHVRTLHKMSFKAPCTGKPDLKFVVNIPKILVWSNLFSESVRKQVFNRKCF